MNSTLGKRLRATREIQKKSQTTVAAVVGVTRTTYGGYERGEYNPPSDKVQKLAKYFGVSVDYLMGNTNFQTVEEAKGKKDEIADIGFELNTILDLLKSKTAVYRFNGQILNDDARTILSDLINVILNTAEKLNNK